MEIGTKVKLKSGDGPSMIVTEIEANGGDYIREWRNLIQQPHFLYCCLPCIRASYSVAAIRTMCTDYS